jgi:hypothetical protein
VVGKRLQPASLGTAGHTSHSDVGLSPKFRKERLTDSAGHLIGIAFLRQPSAFPAETS